MYLGSYGKCAQFTKPALLPDSIMRCSYKDSLFKYCKCFYIDLFLSQLAYFLAGDQGIMSSYKNRLNHITACSLS
jgi:hypothetical protein